MSDGWTEINAAWSGDLNFVGQNATGGTVQMGELDGTPGPTVGPMQMLLLAVASCTGIDIVSILKKKRVKFTDVQVKVRGKRASDYPMIWTEIHILYLIWGEDIKSKDLEQAIQLSEEKYCSVSLMLRKAAKITSEYRILKPSESAE
jgi:putative redox protein